MILYFCQQLNESKLLLLGIWNFLYSGFFEFAYEKDNSADFSTFS
jgi:hypothetical protein